MTEAKHKDTDSLAPGYYFRLSPQGFGALVRAGKVGRVPRPGHEIRIETQDGRRVWATWFAGAYEVRCYGAESLNRLPAEQCPWQP